LSITKAEVERLIVKVDRTPEDNRKLGRYWRRRLRGMLTRLEPVAATAREIIEQGKQDCCPSTRKVVAFAQQERALVIGTATALATAERYAEFKADFEDIAARAEAFGATP
jgi:hypothetical protein